ncbi:MAG: DUF5362 family protein [Phycisphaerae bacterium]
MSALPPPAVNSAYQPELPAATPTGPQAAGFLPYQGPGVVMVSAQAIDILKRTRLWVRFMSVMCFVGAGLMMIGGVFMVIATAFIPHRDPGMIVLGLIYIPFGLLYIIPGVYLHRYASGITRLLQSNDSADLEGALDAQRAFWKFVGVMTIVAMALYAVFIVIFVIIAVFAAVHAKMPSPLVPGP